MEYFISTNYYFQASAMCCSFLFIKNAQAQEVCDAAFLFLSSVSKHHDPPLPLSIYQTSFL